jgi:hypothetical protein
MEINELYKHVWNVGVLLKSDDALSILELDYRPWPKIKEDTQAFIEFTGFMIGIRWYQPRPYSSTNPNASS